MREKRPNEHIVSKYIEFLTQVYESGDNDKISLRELIHSYFMNKTIRKALIDLAIINQKDDKNWHWLSFAPDRKLALTVLNYLNERSKKQRFVPIAGMEEFVTASKTLTEAVNRFTSEVQKSLTGLKNGSNQSVNVPDIFTETENKERMRFELLKSIAGGYYSNPEIGHLNHVERNSSDIIYAVDHLLEQYYLTLKK